jgi:hypothetical protein
MSEPHSDRPLAELEAALKALAPAPARLDRDRLLYRAGQASAPRPGWQWPAAAAAIALTAGTLTGSLAFRPGPQTIERIVYRTAPSPAPQPPPKAPAERPEGTPAQPALPLVGEAVARNVAPDGYLRMRDQVLRWGVEALPSSAPLPATRWRGQATTVHDRLADWLPATSSPYPRGSL